MSLIVRKAKAKPRMEIKVTSADGRVWRFGEQRTGRILGPISRWFQNQRIARYRKARGL